MEYNTESTMLNLNQIDVDRYIHSDMSITIKSYDLWEIKIANNQTLACVDG